MIGGKSRTMGTTKRADSGRWTRGLVWSTSMVVALSTLVLAVPDAGAEPPAPAGRGPSQIAKEVCAQKAQTEIGDALGMHAVVSAPTWNDHLYSCTFQYPSGAMVLSVKELSSWSQTYGYYDELARSLHRTTTVYELGQGAFRVRNGSMVVRKDWKVLLVNVQGLPAQFGSPPTTTPEVALTVAGVILACWHGD